VSQIFKKIGLWGLYRPKMAQFGLYMGYYRAICLWAVLLKKVENKFGGIVFVSNLAL